MKEHRRIEMKIQRDIEDLNSWKFSGDWN